MMLPSSDFKGLSRNITKLVQISIILVVYLVPLLGCLLLDFFLRLDNQSGTHEHSFHL